MHRGVEFQLARATNYTVQIYILVRQINDPVLAQFMWDTLQLRNLAQDKDNYCIQTFN